MDEMIEETLGSEVAEGVAATWDSSEDISGRSEDGNWENREANELKAGPMTTLPPVGMLMLTPEGTADNNDETADDMVGSNVADGPAAETWLTREERIGRKELGSCVACDWIAERIGRAPMVAETGFRVLSTAPAKDKTADETLAANVPEGPTADTWDNSELKAGWAETGSSDAWDLIDDKIAPAPAALPPSVGAREVACPAPANKDETADDRLGASVPDGPAADTCERSEDSKGRIELGRFDAW
jgi:hypothetical protein